MAKIVNTADLLEEGPLSANHNAWIYNGLDCCVTLEVFEKIVQYLDPVTRPIYDLERKLQAPILYMQTRGILVDQRARREAIAHIKESIHLLESGLDRLIQEGLDTTLNWRSPKQLKELLYDILQLPVQRSRSSSGRMAPTTGRAALETLRAYFYAEPIVNHILLLRDLGKELGFLETGIDTDGRIRCNYNIAGTNTGRLASSISDFGTGTNLQNVKRILRKIFVADPGYKFCNIDLEQADSRNVGANCWNKFVESHGEEFAGAYLDACESGDLHTTVTRMARSDLPWGDDEKLWRAIADRIAYRDKSYRDLSKALGHGSNYYGQPPTMAKHAQLPVALAEQFQHRYFTAFPCIRLGHQQTIEQLRQVGHITTFMGRRRCFFGRSNDDRTIRQAIAYEGQSPTADEVNYGMVNLFYGAGPLELVQLLAQMHDSILFQYPEEAEAECVEGAIKALTVDITLKKGRSFHVPVEAKVGWNWADQERDKTGAVIGNFDGLKKWKGADDRKRLDRPATGRWSLFSM